MKALDNCYHCGLPVAPAIDCRVEIDGLMRPMCCPGCLAVATAIVEGGLARFYRYRSNQNVRPEQDAIGNFSAYDLPEVQEDFVTPVNDSCQRVELIVEDITCTACAWLIEHHLGKLSGIEAVRVNVTTHRCLLQWQPRHIKLSEIFLALSDIGYRAHPALDETIKALQLREKSRSLQRLGVAGIGMMQAGMAAVALYLGAFEGMELQWQNLMRWLGLLIVTPVVLFSAQPFFVAAWRNLRIGQLVMDLPVSLAIALAYSASAWATVSGRGEVYFDSVAMFTFFLLTGRYLEMRVRHRNESGWSGLGQLLPSTALRLDQQGETSVAVKSLLPGERVRVPPGETIPCDGTVLTGNSSVIEAVLTGEQHPVRKKPGDIVSAGTVNSENSLLIEVTAINTATRLNAILQLVEQAQLEKPRQVVLADQLAGYFIAGLLFIAALVAGYWWLTEPDRALWVLLSVLVVTCPCALSLATPAALTVATANLRHQGLLIARGHVTDTLAQISTVVFDKTGTLTSGVMTLTDIELLADIPEQQVLDIASALEAHSSHPIARAFAGINSSLEAHDVENIIGNGVRGRINNSRYALGRREFIAEEFGLSIADHSPASNRNWLLLADENHSLAWIALQDTPRKSAANSIEQLHQLGLKIKLLSGDRSTSVESLAIELNIDNWWAEMTPEGKLEQIRALQAAGERVLMVGDGINDVPVLSGADISVAMASAADVTRIHADSILLTDNLEKLPWAVNYARQTRRIIWQNLGWAIFYNLLALPLAAAGMVAPWAAAIGMSVSSLLVVLNALRLGPKSYNTVNNLRLART